MHKDDILTECLKTYEPQLHGTEMASITCKGIALPLPLPSNMFFLLGHFGVCLCSIQILQLILN